jgi:hypothetical protein
MSNSDAIPKRALGSKTSPIFQTQQGTAGPGRENLNASQPAVQECIHHGPGTVIWSYRKVCSAGFPDRSTVWGVLRPSADTSEHFPSGASSSLRWTQRLRQLTGQSPASDGAAAGGSEIRYSFPVGSFEGGRLRSRVITSARSAPGAELHLPRLSLSHFRQRRATCQPIGRRQA